MPKLKKKYFRKRFSYTKDMSYYLILDASSLTPTKIAKNLKKANVPKCRSVLSCVQQQDLAGGCLRLKLFPLSVAELELSLKDLLSEVLCLGLYVNKIWYSLPLLLDSIVENKEFKTMLLLTLKKNYNWIC